MKQIKQYTYSTRKELKTFDIEIKLSSDFKLYFRGEDIPKELHESAKEVFIAKQNKFDSFEELNTKVLTVISDYESQFVEETKQKVILYKIDFTDNHGGQSIEFDFKVVQRIDTVGVSDRGTQSRQSRHYEERLHIGRYGDPLKQKTLDEIDSDGYNEMIWTAEREFWFTTMSDSVRQLGNRLKEGFGKKAEILAQKIDKGMLSQLLIADSSQSQIETVKARK